MSHCFRETSAPSEAKHLRLCVNYFACVDIYFIACIFCLLLFVSCLSVLLSISPRSCGRFFWLSFSIRRGLHSASLEKRLATCTLCCNWILLWCICCLRLCFFQCVCVCVSHLEFIFFTRSCWANVAFTCKLWHYGIATEEWLVSRVVAPCGAPTVYERVRCGIPPGNPRTSLVSHRYFTWLSYWQHLCMFHWFISVLCLTLRRNGRHLCEPGLVQRLPSLSS